MKRYKQVFGGLKKRGEGAFIPFAVLGDPDCETSFRIAKALIDSGADMLELGIAFSDPIADGPVIQEAGQRALKAGINTDKALEIVSRVREYDRRIPIGLLVYCNVVFSYGTDRFYEACKKAGVDSILAADVPIEEASLLLGPAKKHGLEQIFLATLLASRERLSMIAGASKAFIYLVAVLGVTGARKEIDSRALESLRSVKSITSLPVCAGFGISRPDHVRPFLESGADGIIVGSAIVDLVKGNLHNTTKMISEVSRFSRSIKAETISGGCYGQPG